MVTDREKTYKITVEDNFGKTLEKFAKDVKSSDEAFKSLQRSLSSSKSSATTLATDLKKAATATKTLNTSTKALAASSERNRKAIQAQREIQRGYVNSLNKEAVVQQKIANATVRRAAAIRESNKQAGKAVGATKAISKEAAAGQLAIRKFWKETKVATTQQRNFNTQLTRTLELVRRISKFKSLGSIIGTAVGGGGSRTTGGGGGSSSGGLSGAFGGRSPLALAVQQMALLDQRANRVSFTFRRLFGILAGFLIIRRAGQAFADLIKNAFEFNRLIESSTLGIATLVSASFQLRDAFGQAVSPAQELVLAQVAARKQMQLLRQDGLRTAATFTQLLEAFQVSISPGAIAGLDLNQIRTFTVRISQAAAALGVAQNQLAEEIRSILQGTINVRTTRVATALGITNEDIKRAKEAGDLFGFLERRFSAFVEAQEASLGTFTVILSNLRDAVSIVLGAGLEGLFQQIKQDLSDIQGLLLQEVTPGGILQPNPNVLLILNRISRAIQTSVRLAREFAENISAIEAFTVVQAGARLLETFLRGSAAAARFLFKAMVQASAVLTEVLDKAEQLSDKLSASIDFDFDELAKALGIFGTIATVVAVIGVAIKAIGFAFTPIVIAISAAVKLFKGIFIVAGGILSTVIAVSTALGGPLSIAIALGAILLSTSKVLQGWVASIFTFDLKLSTILKLVNTLIKAMQLMPKALELAIVSIQKVFSTFVRSIVGTTSKAISGLFRILEAGTSFLPKSISSIFKAAADGAQNLGEKLDNIDEGVKNSLKNVSRDFFLAADEVKNEFVDIFKNAADDPSVGDFVKNALKDFNKQFDSITNNRLRDFKEGFKESEKEIDLVTAAIENMVPALGRAESSFKEQLATAQKLKDTVLSTQQELRIANVTSAFGSGPLVDSITAIEEAQFKLQDQQLNLSQELNKLEESRFNIRSRQKRQTEEIANLTRQERATFEQGLTLAEKSLKLQAESQRITARKATLEVQIERLVNQGRSAEAQDLRDKVSDLEALEGRVSSNLSVQLQARKALSNAAKLLGIEEEKISGLIVERLQLNANEKSLTEDITLAKEKLTEIERLSLEVLDNRLAKIKAGAEATRIARERELAFQRDQTELIKELNKQEAVGLAGLDAKFIEGTIENLIKARERILRLQDREIRNSEILRDRLLEQADAATTSEEDRIDLLRRAELLTRKIQVNTALTTDEVKKINSEIDDLLEELNRQKIEDKILGAVDGVRSAFEGALLLIANDLGTLEDATKKAFQEMATTFRDAFHDAIEGTAEILSNSIVDALDPTDNSTTIREGFRRLFRQIANDIIKDAFTGIFKSFAAGITELLGANEGGGFFSNFFKRAESKHEGGFIKGYGSPSLAHFSNKAQSFHAGGKPSGVHPKDTVAAWLQPEEFVQPVRAVKAYGAQFMEAVRTLAISPSQVKALMTNVKVRKATASPGRVSFATGGQVSATSANRGSVQVSSGPTQVVMVADEESYERLQAQGKRALIRTIQENVDELAPIFGLNRGSQ